MKNKRILAILLAVVMVICAVPASIFAAPAYDDTQNHWAEEAINRWSEYEVVQGKGEGRFDPEGQMTRAEAAQVFANLLGLNKTADVSKFEDVKNIWYKEAIAKCYAAGILNGKGEGKMDPEGKITREEFMTMYARAICISNGVESEAAKTELTQKGYKDASNVSGWAADSVKTLVDKGFVKGVSETELAPQNNINRASVMALLNQSVSTYVGKNSTKTTVVAKSEGITIIANPNVTKVTGNADVVVVAAGAEKYDETTGKIEHSDIKVESAKMPIARVEGENITVTLTINTEADDAEVTITGVDSEIIVESSSSVKDVKLSAEGSKATIAGKVGTITVEETAKEAVVDTKSTAKVETVDNKAENTTVKGTGTVTEVKSSEDVKVETKNTKVENTNEIKQIIVTDNKGAETKVETKTETSSTETTPSETTVNKEEKPSGGGGYVPPAHTHTFEGKWTADETHHWHSATCSHTTEVSDKAEHTWGTEALASTCAICGFNKDAVAMISKVNSNEYYATLADAVSETAISATITLLKDIVAPSETTYLRFADNVTLDLNGKTIHCGAADSNTHGDHAYIYEGKGLIIKNGTMAGCADTTSQYAYGLYLGSDEDGCIETSSVTLLELTLPAGGINIADAKDVIVKDCNVTVAGMYYAVCVQTDNDKEPSVTIDGGTYSAGTNKNVVWVSSGAAMEIKDGTFTGDFLVDANGALSITGGTFDHSPSEYLSKKSLVKSCIVDNNGENYTYCYTVDKVEAAKAYFEVSTNTIQIDLLDFTTMASEKSKSTEGALNLNKLLPTPLNTNLEYVFSFKAFEDEDKEFFDLLMQLLEINNDNQLGNLTEEAIRSKIDTLDDPNKKERLLALVNERKNYLSWNADFTISFDKSVVANTIALGGQYDNYNENAWVGFGLPYNLEANEDVRMLQTAFLATGNDVFKMNYAAICGWVQEFNCGIANLTDNYSEEYKTEYGEVIFPNNSGVTATIKLKLYEVENGQETGASVDIVSITCTL